MFGKYRKLLLFWGVLLILSLLALVIGLQRADWPGDNLLPPDGLPEQPDEGSNSDRPDGGAEMGAFPWTLALSVATAVISAAGFVGTTFFALRSDRRETALHELQLANLQAEIERQQLEIERLRREQMPPPEPPDQAPRP